MEEEKFNELMNKLPKIENIKKLGNDEKDEE